MFGANAFGWAYFGEAFAALLTGVEKAVLTLTLSESSEATVVAGLATASVAAAGVFALAGTDLDESAEATVAATNKYTSTVGAS